MLVLSGPTKHAADAANRAHFSREAPRRERVHTDQTFLAGRG
jgi:hypothetical protein